MKKFFKDGTQILSTRKTKGQPGKLTVTVRCPGEAKSRQWVLTEKEYLAKQPRLVDTKEK